MVVAFQIPPWRIIIRDSLEVADNVPNGVPPEISFVKPVFITFFFDVVNSDAGHGFGAMVAASVNRGESGNRSQLSKGIVTKLSALHFFGEGL